MDLRGLTPEDLRTVLASGLDLRKMTVEQANKMMEGKLAATQELYDRSETQRKEEYERGKKSYSAPYEKGDKMVRDVRDDRGNITEIEELGPADTGKKQYKYFQSPDGTQIKPFETGETPPVGWVEPTQSTKDLTAMQELNIEGKTAEFGRQLEVIAAGKDDNFKPEDLPLFQDQIDIFNKRNPRFSYKVVHGVPGGFTSEAPFYKGATKPKLVKIPKESEGGSTPSTPPPASQYPTPITLEEFNALPNGTVYINKDGNLYTKP